MRVWTLVATFIFTILVYEMHRAGVNMMSTPPEEFETVLSPSTMLALSNLSAVIRQFDYKDAERLGLVARRAHKKYKTLYETNYYHGYHPKVKTHIERLCYIMHSTYISAMQDLRSYFDMRYLYADNLEYEMGFLSYEIISKYQNILELYHLIQRLYVRNNHTNVAPSNYVLYIYSNIVQISYAVIHLCNMMYELEKKYEDVKETLFDDYHVAKEKKVNEQGAVINKKIYSDRVIAYQRQRAREQRRKQREKKKHREMMMAQGLTTVYRRPKQKRSKHWDLIYGWSIEDH